jgi:DNA-binding SARP family transcriptional activator/tetratricopeptide (TPR) repeat protein
MLEIRVLGELQVRLDGTTAELPASRAARALLAWLAVRPGRHPRSRLAGQFWPDVLDASARGSLRSAIWALRTALGPGFGGYLAAGRDTVTLDGDGLWVDVREVRRLIAAGQPADAVGLCRGELLPELDEDWVAADREDLDREVATALAELTRQAATAGDTAAAAGWARRRAALCPLDELAGADLIRALLAAGDRAAAARELGLLRRRLASELGVEVSGQTAALIGPADPMRRASRPARPAPRPAGPAEPAGQAAEGLIGRERELAPLSQSWRAACQRSGGVVLIEGDGGIGKTRLVEELQAAAAGTAEDHAIVAGATAARPGRAAPFAVWTDALGDIVPATGPPADDPAWAGQLARIVPSLAAPTAGRTRGPDRPDPVLERVQLCEAVVQFLGWVAQRGPLLLTLEDLHLADAASVELTAYVGRRLGRLPVLLVLTRRLLPPRQDLDTVAGALRSRRALIATVSLGPLTTAQTRALVRATAEVPDGPAEQIVRLAAGSPLLATAAARAAVHSGAEPATELATGLGGAVRQAAGMLTRQARMFLEFAAAAGRDLDRHEVATLPLPDPAGAATEALGSGLLRAENGRTGFRHALLRDAVYQEIPEPVRTRLHAALAGLLRGQASGRRGIRAAEIARHLKLAGQDQQAVSHLLHAARDARAVAAMAEAAGFLAEAAQITPDDPELLIDLAEVEAFRGLLDDSDRAFGHALEQVPPQDTGALLSAWLRRGRWLRGGICHPRESRRSYLSALDVLDRDPAADPQARAEALAGMAWAEAVAGDPAAVDGLLAEAGHTLGPASPAGLLSHDIGVARGHALIRAGRFTDSFGPLIAASAAASRAGRADMAYSCLSNAASAAACAGQFGRALDFADRCLPLVVPNGLLRLAVYAQLARSAILRRLDRLAEARQAADAAAGYADRTGLAELDGLVRAEHGLLALDSGEPAQAAVELAAALDLGAPVSRAATRLRLAEALAQAGQPGAAEAEIRRVTLEPVSPSDFPATLVARMSHVEGLIAAARDEPTLAQRRLAESVAGWQRIAVAVDPEQDGGRYVAALIDLGRPPLSSLVEPAREAAAVAAALIRIRSAQAGAGHRQE